MQSVKRNAVCLLMIMFLLGISVTNTYAATYSLDVKKYAQEKDKWCWDACAQMVGNYHGRYYSQSNICTKVKGSVTDKGASHSETTTALSYTTGKTALCSGTISFASFITCMKNKKPPLICVHWNNGGGHVYVVSGASEASGPALSRLYLIDPLSGNANAYYTYSYLINGTTLKAGTGKYNSTWRGGL